MEWIKVTDKLPREFEKVLLTDLEEYWIGHLQKCKHTNVFWACNPDFNRDYWSKSFPAMPYLTVAQPTHWAFLPELPK